MQFVCDAPPKTWFRIETEGEAALESRAMNHAVENWFKQAYEQATKSYVPPRSAPYIEQNIGLKAHIQRVMPLFLTLRDAEGNALVTAMLPPLGKDERSFKPIVVGVDNTDPYPEHGDAIRQLARHYGLTLDPARCYPYRRGCRTLTLPRIPLRRALSWPRPCPGRTRRGGVRSPPATGGRCWSSRASNRRSSRPTPAVTGRWCAARARPPGRRGPAPAWQPGRTD